MRWSYRILYFLFFFLKIYTILAILENLGKKANLGLKLGVLIFLLLKSWFELTCELSTFYYFHLVIFVPIRTYSFLLFYVD